MRERPSQAHVIGHREMLLYQNLLQHTTWLHADNALVEALIGVGELQVVEAELVEDGGVEVPGLYFVEHGVVADLIRLPVADASLHAAAGHPDRIGIHVVIAAR